MIAPGVPHGSGAGVSQDPGGHPWMPTSPCGPSCMPRRGGAAKAGIHRVALRLSRALLVLLLGAGFVMTMPVLRGRMRRQFFQAWFRWLLGAFGIRYVLFGKEHLGRGGALVVSNHVSWLDVVVLQAIRPMRLLAKTEVRSWPVIGPLAARAGTLYIDRDRLTALPGAVRAIADALRGGAVVGAFPEGTTWCGVASGRYRPAVFQAAVDARVPVQPMALRFRTADGRRTTVAAFVGDATLFDSVLAVLRTRRLVIEVSVLPELDAARLADRRELARLAEAALVDAPVPASSAAPREVVAA
jgi:1-acyl-sn-glycerol-3-phosphate acyltransferase